MKRELYDQAEKIVTEIDKIDMLVNYVNYLYDDSEGTKDYSDTKYIIDLVGSGTVINALLMRKSKLENELEKL